MFILENFYFFAETLYLAFVSRAFPLLQHPYDISFQLLSNESGFCISLSLAYLSPGIRHVPNHEHVLNNCGL